MASMIGFWWKCCAIAFKKAWGIYADRTRAANLAGPLCIIGLLAACVEESVRTRKMTFWPLLIPPCTVVAILLYQLARAPYDLVLAASAKTAGLERANATLSAETSRLKDQVAPLDVEPVVFGRFFRIAVSNKNFSSPAKQVKATLLKIDPAPEPSRAFPSVTWDMAFGIELYCANVVDRIWTLEEPYYTVSAGIGMFFDVFHVSTTKDRTEIEVSFVGRRNEYKKFKAQTLPAERPGKVRFAEYHLQILVSAEDRMASRNRFKLTFSREPSEPLFSISRV